MSAQNGKKTLWRFFAMSAARIGVVVCGSFLVLGLVLWAIAPLRGIDEQYRWYILPLLWVISAVFVSFALDLFERIIERSKNRYWGRVFRLMARRG